MDQELANRIYDILMEECGADEYWRENFVQCQKEGCREYRFQGDLGFGGKFWDYDNRFYVNYYPENTTPERDAMVEKVNKRLAELK